jgi:drug/metabolite transporter (DMT)-like permease
MHVELPPLGLSFWRWAVACGILSIFALHHLWRQREIARRHIGFITVQGLLGVAGFNSLIYMAMQTTTAINAVLVNSCIPVLIAVYSWILFKEVMRPRQWLGVFISLGGVLLIISRGDITSLLGVTFNRGDLLILVAAQLWALYSANLRRYPKELHPFSYQMGIVIVGIIGIFPFFLLELSSGRAVSFNLPSVITILYVAVFASVLAFIFWNRAVRSIGANRAGPFIHLMPVFSTILAVIFLKETLQLYHLGGILLIFSGILMTTLMIPPRSA